jgi:glycosyltransferase involved in cell wall biosynthesis
MGVARVAVVCDLLEEHWPSMDLVAEKLLHHLQGEHTARVQAVQLRPPLRRRLTRAWAGDGAGAPEQSPRFNLDRALNRFWDYPRLLRGVRGDFDVFHVVDHSYGQLVHHLPAARTVVTCHDLHTFQSILEPGAARRSLAFRAMTRRILAGMTRAARIVFDTEAVRQAALAHGLVTEERAVVAHLGVDPVYSVDPDPTADREAARLLGPASESAPEVLHVGGTFRRKRIDLVLRIFAEVRARFPGTRLLRVGGPFTGEQQEMAGALGLDGSVVVLPFLERRVLAAVYRRAALAILPSEEEGFGFPVLEAMASGTPIVASDLAVLREVGGPAATYCPVGDVTRWGEVVVMLLTGRRDDPVGWAARCAAGLARAAEFSWGGYARKMVRVYQEIADP